MIRINENWTRLQSSYLFTTVARKVAAFKEKHPEREILRLGIGDVTRALPESIVAAFRNAVDEMGDDRTFRGYGPDYGYDFLRETIAENDYRARGARVEANEIFISDGAKCDSGNFQEILSLEARVAVPDPVYPVYVDSNVMAGRAGVFRDGRYEGLVYLDSTEANGFVPGLPTDPVDVVYLCFPNNPTGAVASREQLGAWVAWAREHGVLILFDAAYEAFIRDERIPHSIYEIPGAREVAVEFRSFSKTAGFTGTRCAYTVVPAECTAADSEGRRVSLRELWSRRQSTKFNGVAYPVQAAAAAVYTEAGRRQTRASLDFYLENARIIRERLTGIGLGCVGGENSPYVWAKTGMDSWEFFDLLLEKAGVVCTPGSGFGRCGEGYARFSAFGGREQTLTAMERIAQLDLVAEAH